MEEKFQEFLNYCFKLGGFIKVKFSIHFEQNIKSDSNKDLKN